LLGLIGGLLAVPIAAAVLLNFNAGPVKGFALTLLVGLVTSVFTALFMTKTYFYTWVEKTAQKTLKFSSWITNANFNFLAYAKKAVIFSLFVVLAGTAALIQRKSEFFGMDFKGGLSLDIALSSSDKPS